MVSRKALFGAAAGFVAFAISVIVWSGLGILGHQVDRTPPPVNSPLDLRSDAGVTDARVLNDVLLRQFGTRLEGAPKPSPQP